MNKEINMRVERTTSVERLTQGTQKSAVDIYGVHHNSVTMNNDNQEQREQENTAATASSSSNNKQQFINQQDDKNGSNIKLVQQASKEYCRSNRRKARKHLHEIGLAIKSMPYGLATTKEENHRIQERIQKMASEFDELKTVLRRDC